MSSLPNLVQVPSSSSDVSLPTSTRSASVAQMREEKPTGLARSIFSRSSRLLHKRKSSSKLRSTDGQTGGKEGTSQDAYEIGYRKRPKHGRLDSYESQWKPAISEPYNFQHLTHTAPSQAKTLQSASHNELITEFSVIRASQAPRPALKGIKAEDIPAPFSPDASSFASPITSFESPVESRPTSPSGSPIGSEGGRSLRTSKSIDSFTRVSSKSFSSPKPPISPPPRRSSRQMLVMQPIPFGLPSTKTESPTVPNVSIPAGSNTSPNSYFTINNPLSSPPNTGSTNETARMDSSEIAQAVTTPDDSAFLIINTPRVGSSTALADVPEEEEDGSRRDARDKARTLRHARSFPSARSFVKPAAERLPWSTPQLENDEWQPKVEPALPSRQQPRERHVPSMQSSQTSDVSATSRSSWEDDIDYCYEHAMEADGSEWDESSADETFWMHDDTTKSSTPTPALNQHRESQISSPRNSYINNFHSEPEEIASASSSSISVPGVVTPSDPTASLRLPEPRPSCPPLPLSPSFSIPNEYASRVTHEESYTQNVTEADVGEQAQPPFPYYTPNLRVDFNLNRDYNSPRSSGSPISKQTSHESFVTGKSSAAASRHRRSSSVGSVPDLVASSSLAAAGSSGPHIESPELLPPPLSLKTIRANSPALAPGPTSAPLTAPASFAARSRANSDATRVFSDLALIGAPTKPHSRSRAGSVAVGGAARPKGHRTSYSLFPQGSMSSLREPPTQKF
ncbi:hypothetical protein MMC10_005177 [Thelotrema lepadinum]|nr:hypothetical protein [Thelotrema lepadinum]